MHSIEDKHSIDSCTAAQIVTAGDVLVGGVTVVVAVMTIVLLPCRLVVVDYRHRIRPNLEDRLYHCDEPCDRAECQTLLLFQRPFPMTVCPLRVKADEVVEGRRWTFRACPRGTALRESNRPRKATWRNGSPW